MPWMHTGNGNYYSVSPHHECACRINFWQSPFPSCLPAFYTLAIPVSCYISSVFLLLVYYCVTAVAYLSKYKFSKSTTITFNLLIPDEIINATSTLSSTTLKQTIRSPSGTGLRNSEVVHHSLQTYMFVVMSSDQLLTKPKQ